MPDKISMICACSSDFEASTLSIRSLQGGDANQIGANTCIAIGSVLFLTPIVMRGALAHGDVSTRL
ncbi:uncharacterized protein LAESUDRAFT_723729 [Laetiporus sulphureus 93-53]|uniref:Uncharacterized protein n=1 Tax=Laetiporus sulphureus 93-53 TaxID=1314785 RepID=A0A165FDC8_9APHY|nr:uncharacterized protein LAESUDRAFT_723729 [Laetiporus sulphureus 93-53]KZT08797.1 hypothetical protein LAESUDRAFT_723729 [Laetiporus sulphureus 93-53]